MKDKIITAAVELFNEYGVNKTSFRNIASSLEISDGHVRYYYKTKENLLLEIFDKMNNEILNLTQSDNNTLDTSQYLKNNLNAAFTIMVNYSFFFIETPKTFNQYPQLALLYRNLVKDRKELFLNLFKSLTAKGFFEETFSDKLQEYAFYSIFIISDSWIRYYMLLNNHKPNKESVDFHSNLAFSILMPYIKK